MQNVKFSFSLGFINYSLPLLVIRLIDTNQFCCCASSGGLAWVPKGSHVQLKTDHGRNPFINPVLWGNNESTGGGKILRDCDSQGHLKMHYLTVYASSPCLCCLVYIFAVPMYNGMMKRLHFLVMHVIMWLSESPMSFPFLCLCAFHFPCPYLPGVSS